MPHRTQCKLVIRCGGLPPSHAPAELWRTGRVPPCCGTRDTPAHARGARALAAPRRACRQRRPRGGACGVSLPYPTLPYPIRPHLHLLAVGERDPARHMAQRRAQALAPRRQVQLRAGAARAQPRARRRCETGSARVPRRAALARRLAALPVSRAASCLASTRLHTHAR